MTESLTAHLAYHQVDAFTRHAFAGNPAAVYVLDDWLDDERLQAIAAEHNLAETAFVVPDSASSGHLRWFTPTCEVELCGHATLATAHVLLTERTDFAAPLTFTTEQAGELYVEQTDGRLWLNLPADAPTPCDDDLTAVASALGATPEEWQIASNYVAVFASPDTVAALTPDFAALARALAGTNHGVIATAPADAGQADDETLDFVSRYFAPAHGINEDPVTGSAHCTLAPYWGARLGKTALTARQISARGGTLACGIADDRIHIGGDAVTVAAGTLFIDTSEVVS
ncbi:PhzF family phenazine biosynthesis protein [Salinisphaera japonica]|uniref:Isomerase n=1 Tax=Salinisphaera japonica YTM-1 TaxID=1209778 RepID=A0A423Q0A6_9GAMM|nr:PhzF family phenazine biosynthesis protein [Salinisphaera japonica]ROO31415.1 isomerase [Salinisphaera japonica YTM-1]